MDVITELFNNMMHSTTRGFIGVIFIFAYMAWIVAMALHRINKGEHLDHH